jgi:hypothetical protein
MSSVSIHINSYNRISGDSDNFVYDISNQIDNINDYKNISLISASIPKTYYLINSTTDRFNIIEYLSGKNKIMLIPHGNYSIISLCNYFNQNFGIGLDYTYVFTPNLSNGKITITVSGNNGSNIRIDFTNENNPALIIGFNEIIYDFNSSLTSPNICNFQLTNSILVCSSIVKNQIIDQIYPNSNDFSYIIYVNHQLKNNFKILNNTKFNTIDLYLLDPISQKPINLNGINSSYNILLFTDIIKNLYYKLMIEDYLHENYLKKLDLDKKQLENKMDE